MKKFIGVIAVAVLIVAFSAPIASASPVVTCPYGGPGCPPSPSTPAPPMNDSAGCSKENMEFEQPSTKPQAYTIDLDAFARRIIVKYSVAGTFTGTCRGFLSGNAVITVRNPDGTAWREYRPHLNLQFKNGFNDTGKRFKDRFDLKYRRPIPAGTCVTSVVSWQHWFYNDGREVPNGLAKTVRTRGCYRST